MKIIDKYLLELQTIKNYSIQISPIDGHGVFADTPFKKGDFINTHFNSNYDITEFGKHLNHSSNPNAKSVRQKDYSFKTYADRDINKGDEITLDYTKNKDLEQPKKGWK